MTDTRTMWLLCETIHAVIYFAPEKVENYSAAGLKGGWMGYFASRAAAMGAVGPDVVAATFYNFDPAMVRRAIPDAWRFSTPERVLDARHATAETALRRLLGDEDRDGIVTVADMLWSGLEGLDRSGRPLGAAHAGLPRPDDPLLSLWLACTVWREHRGDGHVAVLVAEGIGPIEAHLLAAGAGMASDDALRTNRGWSEERWGAARQRMQDRGLVHADGTLTEEGVATKGRVERLTDELSAAPWIRLGHEATAAVAERLRSLVGRLVAQDAIPFPNPIGLRRDELDRALRG